VGKRGNGEGSVSYQKSRHRYVAAVGSVDEHGKAVRKFFYDSTRKEVADKLTIALREHQQGCRRTVPLIPAAVNSLLAQRARQAKLPHPIRPEHNFVFADDLGSADSWSARRARPEDAPAGGRSVRDVPPAQSAALDGHVPDRRRRA
jgi:hypothetical protein